MLALGTGDPLGVMLEQFAQRTQSDLMHPLQQTLFATRDASIIGSVSCSTGSHQPVLVCFASALFALFLIGGSFPPRGRCSLARPILRPAWSRRYLFKFQHALGHRHFLRVTLLEANRQIDSL